MNLSGFVLRTELPADFAVGDVVWAFCPEDKLFWPAVVSGHILLAL